MSTARIALWAVVVCTIFPGQWGLNVVNSKSTASSSSRMEGWGPNPIHKVTGMLNDMKTELEKEKETEKEVFEKAMCICETGEAGLQKVIDQSNTDIPRLTSSIESMTAETKKLKAEIKAHEEDKAATESA